MDVSFASVSRADMVGAVPSDNNSPVTGAHAPMI
jgi:hypothetical protein